MGNLKEVFESMNEMYNEQVVEADKKGYANKFKLASEMFFELLEDDKYMRGSPKITITDVKYLDGYFIFGFGTNSILHFKVKEAPGWKFAVWWDVSRNEVGEEIHNNNFIQGEFFCQYEDTIDKFKPTASTMTDDFSIKLDNKDSIYIYGVKEIISFIIKQPHLAFCRDYHGWNYNVEYHSPREARREFKKYLKHKKLKVKTSAKNDKIIIRWVKNNILPQFIGAEIVDRGESWSPQFEVFAPFEENKELHNIEKIGYYGWFGSDDDPLYIEWKNLTSRLRKGAINKDVYWYTPFNDSIGFYGADEMGDE